MAELGPTSSVAAVSDIGEAVSFYEALGFRRTYGQVKPNPYVVVELGEIGIHHFGIDGFDPAESYGSTVIL
ncbi:MAG: VOC family protein, partial [Acidimicrobiia bacterium]